MKLAYEAALATMSSIADYTSADFDTLGISYQDFNLVYGNTQWTRDQRRRVTQTLDALLFGTLDVIGLPRIAVPAEYVAAVISSFVAPANRQIACIWLAEQRATGPRAIDLAAAGVEALHVDPVSASQLFALVILLSENDRSSEVRQSFAQRMDKRTADLTREFVQ